MVALLAIGALSWKAIAAPDGVADPTAPGADLAHGAVVTNTALLVFREGLEAVLVPAAFTASFVGANGRLRRPVAAGAALALLASVATWFIAIEVIGALGGGLRLQAGSATVLEGVSIGVGLTALVGIATFAFQQRLPYRRMPRPASCSASCCS